MQRWLRLQQRSAFQRLRKEGRVKKHPTLILSYAPNHLTHNRYGFITAKHLGKAVWRNRIRRQLREAVRRLHPHLQPGYDLVFIARRPILGQPFAEIERTVDSLTRRAGLKK